MFRTTFWITLALLGSLLFKNVSAEEPFKRSLHKPAATLVKTPRNGPVLYDQLLPLSWGGIVSHEMTDPGNAPMTSVAADDFIVPAGDDWAVHYVNMAGFYFGYTGVPVSSMNVSFYADNNGVPGAILFDFPGLTSFNELPISGSEGVYLYEISLSAPVTLTAGHYWVSVQAVSDYTVTGQWGFYTQDALVIENEFHWKNPLDGFGFGYTDWTPASVVSWGSQNLAFSLCGPGMENDLSVSSITQPVSAPGLTNAEYLTALVKNEGPTMLTGFNMSYTVNGGTPVTENVGGFVLNPNQTAAYTFTTPANLSVAGPYTLTVYANNASDPNHGNDTVATDIYNMGTIYPMVSTGTQTITTCGATFTDAGGLEGPIGMNDDAITTIYPANAGDRVRLTFLMFDASWGGFSVYNGIDMNAPLMGTWNGTNGPGELTALNNDGALTIHFMGPGWEETAGWVAYISCVTPLADEFEMSSLTGNLTTVFEGNNLVLTAHVQNLGTLAQDKAVNFTVNGTSIGSVNTGLLNPYDTVSVVMNWPAVTPGDYTFVAALPADGDLTNNSQSITRTVLAYNAFFEDFEGAEFPPANWYHGGFWGPGNNPAGGAHNASSMFSSTQHDTLVSCRVDLGTNPNLHFYAKTSMWWPGNLDIYFFSESTHTWNYVQNIVLPIMSYGSHNVDLSAFAGQTGRIGFFVNVTDPYAWSGQVDLDLITGENITMHFDDYDLKSVDFTGSEYYTTSEASVFHLTVKNNGLLPVAAGTYRAALMQGDAQPLELYSLSGNAIAPGEEQTYELMYTFNELDQFPVFGRIYFDDDQYMANNTSEKVWLAGLADSAEIVVVGEGNFLAEAPIVFYNNHSLTETLYTGEEIGRPGVIFGVSYKFNFATDELNVPVKIWMGATAQQDLATAWVPAGDLTQVYEGTVDFLKEKGTIYLPFQTPFNYADTTLNLAIMVQKTGDHTSIDQYFINYGANFTSTLLAGSNSEAPDPFAPPAAGQSNINPLMEMVFNDNLGSASGTVTDAAAAPLEAVKVRIEPLNITVHTDASGSYSVPYVPAGSYATTASLFGYQPNTQSLGVTLANNTVLDFQLEALGMVTITGTVEGNDNPGTGIANATVALTGYSPYSTTTDALGNFTLEGVFIADNYTLTIQASGYDAYVDVMDVDGAIDLGTITLTEAMSLARVVIASDTKEEVDLTWYEPSTTAGTVLQYDDGTNEDGYAGEPLEAVWLGNYFPVTEPVTITSFDLYWAKYGTSTPQVHRLDIYDKNKEHVYSSEPFTGSDNQWVNVQVTPMTFSGNYYVMVYWENTPVQSNYLGIDTLSATTPDYAYYHYDGGDFLKLSGLTNFYGTFLMHANALMGDDVQASQLGQGSREITGYDVTFGLFDDLGNAGNWPLLNSVPLTETAYTDETWPPAVADRYIYGVKTRFTTGESDFSFSGIVVYDPTNTFDLTIRGIKLYPNPVTEILTIETANSGTGSATGVNSTTGVNSANGTELMLFNMEGQLIYRAQVSGTTHQLDVTRFAKGTVLVVLKTATGIAQEKVIIR